MEPQAQLSALAESSSQRPGPDAARRVIDLRGVSVSYGDGRRRVEALSDASLCVHAGERVTLLGPSGCGKSTLLSLVAGLVEADRGSVFVDGEVALMPQSDLLVPWRSALRNAALALEAQGVPRAVALARAEPLFERFGLASFEHSMPWQLSGGMRQRVAFLRTVLTGRPVLALDEPFGALDSITRTGMHEWLASALDADPHTLLMVTHDVDEALSLAGRVAVMSSRPGRIVHEIAVDRPAGTPQREWLTCARFGELKAEALEALS